MAEVKNAFIKSKMNKDLDSRLIPSGEYRNAINAQISRSEGSDVGALENVLGNKNISDLGLNIPNLSSIGYLCDEANSIIYVFLTDNDNTFYSPTGVGSNHYIASYNEVTGNNTVLVTGSFLNFSKLNPIFGVNLIENLLFWTDNRNQPRKINVISATQLNYYTTEDNISVAKYNPYQPIELYQASSLSPGNFESTMKDVSSISYVTGGTSTVQGTQTSVTAVNIENTDIKIGGTPLTGQSVKFVDILGNVVDFSPAITVDANSTSTLLNVSAPTTFEDGISLVFDANPYYVPNYKGDPKFIEDKFIRFSYRFKFNDGEYSIMAPFTQPCFIPKQDGYFLNNTLTGGDEQKTFSSSVVDFMENKVNKIDLKIPLPSTVGNLKNDLHVEDIDILYKESDGLAVQVVETINSLDNFNTNQADSSLNTLTYVYKSQIPYKTLPSKEITRVYDKVPVRALSQEIISNRVVYGNFQDKHTPPAFLDYNVTSSVKSDFDLSEGATDPTTTTSIIEYPSSSLKTNRNYQAGFVLCDKFGRQSTVILSNNIATSSTFSASTVFAPYLDESIDSFDWVGNSLKITVNSPISTTVPDSNSGDPGTYNGDVNSVNYNPLGWYSYKVVVKQVEQEYYNIYSTGAMKGLPYNHVDDGVTITGQNTSFISLVNDNINKIPRDLSEIGPQDKAFRSSVQLYGRVENTSTLNKQFYPGRKSFTTSSIEDLYDLFDVKEFTIPNGTVVPITSSENPFSVFWKSDSNPFIAQITTSQSSNSQFGVENTVNVVNYTPIEKLAIFETAPTVSRLDIFWETSSSGLITDLNNVVLDSSNGGAGFSSWNDEAFLENNNPSVNSGDILNVDFLIVDNLGSPITLGVNDTFVLNSVIDNQTPTASIVTNWFELYEPNGANLGYNVRVTQDFVNEAYYGATSGINSFNFSFTSNIDGIVTNYNQQANLSNVSPVMSGPGNGGTTPSPSDPVFSLNADIAPGPLLTFTATNGANLTNNQGRDITWSIAASKQGQDFTSSFGISVSQTPTVSTCLVQNISTIALLSGTYVLTLKCIDAGGAEQEITINVVLGIEPTRVVDLLYNYSTGDDEEGEAANTARACVILINNSPDPAGNNGGYLLNGTWESNVSGVNTLFLNQSSSCPALVGMYSPSGIGGAISAWKGCFANYPPNHDLITEIPSSEYLQYGFEVTQ